MIDRAVQHVPVDELVCRKQVRELFDEDELAGLALSIKEHGVLIPLLARLEDTTFILVDGERRLRAARRAGLSVVPVIVEDRELGVAEIVQRQLIANCQRADLTPIEKARAFQQLMDQEGWTAAELATRLGISAATVSRTRALLGLPAEVRERVARGDLAAATAYEIARTPDAATKSQRLQDAATGTPTPKGAAQKSRGRSDSKRKHKSRGRDKAVVLPVGPDGVMSFQGETPAPVTLEQWIEQLLESLRDAIAQGIGVAELAKRLVTARKPSA